MDVTARPPDGRPPAEVLAFDPASATVVREPPGTGYGFWAGGHKVSWDADSATFVLFYRLRSPVEQGRGGVARVAVGTDGVHFDDVWEVTKAQLVANSIEVGHCVRHDAGEWRLYLSYEFAGGPIPFWRVDVLRGDSPGSLDTQGRRTVLMPYDYGLRTLKDPWAVRTPEGGYRVYAVSEAHARPQVDGAVTRARPLDATVLAESDDGLVFPTVRRVYEPPGDGSWHGNRGRVNCLFRYGEGWAGTFDGGRTNYDNFEEWCGLVHSPDGLRIEREETDGPWVRSPHGCVRYVWGLRVRQRLLWYFEHTREDGSHDLRVAEVDLPEGL